MESSLICYPDNDSILRYLLGKKGENNLFVVGLNPSNADAQNLDPTSRNIEQIAKQNGYDGWLLVNLYPVRQSKPAELSIEADREIFWYNLHLIEQLMKTDQFKIKDAWLCWGDSIDSFNHSYLKQAAGYLYKKLVKFDLDYYCIGRTRKANPCHPSQQAINCHLGGIENLQFINFNFKNYVRDIKLEPEIKINGLEFK